MYIIFVIIFITQQSIYLIKYHIITTKGIKKYTCKLIFIFKISLN